MANPFDDPEGLFDRVKGALDSQDQEELDSISADTTSIPLPPLTQPAKRALWLWIQTIGASQDPEIESEGLQEEYDAIDQAADLSDEQKEYMKKWYTTTVGKHLKQSGGRRKRRQRRKSAKKGRKTSKRSRRA